MSALNEVRHWVRGRFIVETYRVKTRRLGVVLSQNWTWGEPSGWKLAFSAGGRRLVFRRF